MKDEEFQGFTTFDFMTVVFSVIVVIAVSTPIIKKNFQSDNSLEIARRDVGLLPQAILGARSLGTFAMRYSGQSGSRSIASVDENSTFPQVDINSLQSHLKAGEWQGDVGKDPWGRPYHFAFLRSKSGLPTHLAVWSDGPNGKNDGSVKNQIENSVSPQDVKFNGDAVGVITPVR